VQPGRTCLQQFRTQCRRDLDADASDLGGIVEPADGVDHPRRHFRAAELSHPGDLLEIGDRHDPGDDRLVHVEVGELLDEADVVLGLEEELGDGEVGTLQLGREVAAVRLSIGGLRVDLGVCSDPDGEVARLGDVFEQVGGVRVVARPRGTLARRVAAEGEDVDDARVVVVGEDLGDLAAHVTLAGEVGHRRDRGLLGDPADDVTGAFAGRSARPVCHGNETRS
jgi:hypothetical protein